MNLLIFHGIEALVDVRRFPKSKFEHFSAENLQKIGSHGIEYIQKPLLGGFRKKILKDSPNKAIKSPGFRNYADFMLTDEFEHEILELIEIARRKRTAIMCAEKFFWRCHRKFISDYLCLLGFKVVHIIDQRTLIHKMSKNARIEGRKLIYDLEF